MLFAIPAFLVAWFFLGAPDIDLHDYRAAFNHAASRWFPSIVH